jgi:hypothetical protein
MLSAILVALSLLRYPLIVITPTADLQLAVSRCLRYMPLAVLPSSVSLSQLCFLPSWSHIYFSIEGLPKEPRELSISVLESD